MVKAKNKTIFILHGWAVRDGNLSEEKWQPFFEALSELGIKSVLLKIPGLSSPLNEVWQLNDFVNWLKKELDKSSKDNKVILLGHSFGGQIAAKFTAQNFGMVEKLILVDSAGIRNMSFFAIIKRTVFLLAAKVGKLFFRSEILRNSLYKLARESDYKNAPPLLRRTMSNVIDEEVIEDLAKIKVTTKIIWGENDKVTPVKFAYKMHKLIVDSDLSFVKDARHSPQFTHPQETARIIGDFLK